MTSEEHTEGVAGWTMGADTAAFGAAELETTSARAGAAPELWGPVNGLIADDAGLENTTNPIPTIIVATKITTVRLRADGFIGQRNTSC